MDLNELISKAAPNSEVLLPSGEFEGPLIINKPLRVRGKTTTIWAKRSPVVEIKSGGVTLENIRAEITEGSIEEPAVKASAACAVRNVEVLGRVSGFGAEDSFFDIPRTIALGSFPASTENTYMLEVNVPAKTEIFCELREVTFEPKTLEAGRNTLTIKISEISAMTFLYAEVLFKSKFTRRVYLTGKPDASAEKAEQKQIYTAPERLDEFISSAEEYEAQLEVPMTDVIANVAGRQLNHELPTLDMKRGQRVGLLQYLGEQFEVWFTANMPQGIEIDPYVFLLQTGDKAIGDEGLVFFGNARSKNGEALYFPEDGHVAIDLTKVPPEIQKIALAYSIYDGGPSKNFRSVSSPRVSLRVGEERVVFNIEGLGDEATIVALEFYLYKGEWKISAVGAGFRNGLAKLCNHYGIEVE